MSHRIFVFGSNLAGRHGKGSAREAYLNHGARYWQGEGLQGRSYAIPTKDKDLRTLPLNHILHYVQRFVGFASVNRIVMFDVVPIGCGLAGYKPSDIAPMFLNAPDNVVLPPEFRKVLDQ